MTRGFIYGCIRKPNVMDSAEVQDMAKNGGTKTEMLVPFWAKMSLGFCFVLLVF